MIDSTLASAGDRHLNIFYTYQTHHLENNVTRALIIALRNLAPVHLRLFLRDVILRKKPNAFRQRIQLLTASGFEFDLQVGGPSDENDKLDARTGVIVGINYSGKQNP